MRSISVLKYSIVQYSVISFLFSYFRFEEYIILCVFGFLLGTFLASMHRLK